MTNEQTRLLDTSDQIVHEREQDIQHIYNQVNDISDIFKTLQNLVSSQGENVTQIENNTAQTVVNVSDAHQELNTANLHLKKKNCCWIIILVAFAIIVVLILIFV